MSYATLKAMKRGLPTTRPLIQVLLVLITGLTSISTLSAQQPSVTPSQTDRRAEILIKEADELREEGTDRTVTESIRKYTEALKIVEPSGDKKKIVEILNRLGAAECSLDTPMDPLATFRRALDMYVALSDSASEAAMLNEIGRMSKDISSLQRAFQLRERLGDYDGQAESLSNLAFIQISSSEREYALAAFQEALRIATAARLTRRVTVIRIGLAILYKQLGDEKQAAANFAEALENLWKIGDGADEAAILDEIEFLYSELGAEVSGTFFEQALSIHRKGRSGPGEAVTLESIGIVKFRLRLGPSNARSLGAISSGDALQFFSAATSLYKQSGDTKREFRALANMGRVYFHIGKKSEALEFFEKAAAVAHASANQDEEISAMICIGSLYDHIGNRKKALEVYQQVLASSAASGNKRDEALALNGIGVVQSRLGEKRIAMDAVAKAQAIFKTLGDRRLEALTQSNIGAINFDVGETGKGLEMLEQSLPILREFRKPDRAEIRSLSLESTNDDLTNRHIILNLYDQALGISVKVTITKEPPPLITNLVEPWGTGCRPQVPKPSNRRSAGLVLGNLGAFNSIRGEKTAAAERFQAAESILKDVSDSREWASVINNATVINNQGRINDIRGDYIEDPYDPLHSLRRAESLFKAWGNESGAAIALNNIGRVIEEKGDREKALSIYESVLTTFIDIGDKKGEATALNNIGRIHDYYDRREKALEAYGKALRIYESLEDRVGIASTLNNMGLTRLDLGETGEALKLLNQALPIQKKTEYRNGEATTLNNIGRAYDEIGDRNKAIEFLNAALPIFEKTENSRRRAAVLNNLGSIYMDLGSGQSKPEQTENALRTLDQALDLFNKTGDQLGTAITLNNIAQISERKGETDKAREYYSKALDAFKTVKFRRGEGAVLNNIATLERRNGQRNYATYLLVDALMILREVGDPRGEAVTLSNLMMVSQEMKRPRLAILYGKQAINIYQKLRGRMSELDKELQKVYLDSVADSYRTLADLLMDADRIAEAQAVLAMLKEDEFKTFVRDASESKEQAQLTPTDSERKALEEYARLSDEIAGIGKRFNELGNKRNCKGCRLQEAEEKEYKELEGKLDAANEGFRAFVKRLETEFSKEVETGARITPETVQALQSNIQESGPGVVLVSTYLMKDRYRVIVTTGTTMVDRKVEYKDRGLTENQIKDKIIRFQEQLQNVKVDPRPLGKELYDIFVAPIAADLEYAKAKDKTLTVLWSLDGRLRYIPIGALSPDGKRYLAEDHRNVIVTLARQGSLFQEPSKTWNVLGAGASKGGQGFSPLKSVPEELKAIVRNKKQPLGAFAGEPLLDPDFKESTFSDTLQRKTVAPDGREKRAFNVVHLATHFKLEANNRDSAMLLGDGTLLSLDRFVRNPSLSFSGVELVTLSACKTAVPVGEGNGSEVEGFGMIAQQRGAKAVIASLWSVADESTSLLMAEFYRQKAANPKMTKAEALQKAQLAMISGKLKGSVECKDGKDCSKRSGAKDLGGDGAVTFERNPEAPYSHPYFWSPFVLIGNWR